MTSVTLALMLLIESDATASVLMPILVPFADAADLPMLLVVRAEAIALGTLSSLPIGSSDRDN